MIQIWEKICIYTGRYFNIIETIGYRSTINVTEKLLLILLSVVKTLILWFSKYLFCFMNYMVNRVEMKRQELLVLLSNT